MKSSGSSKQRIGRKIATGAVSVGLLSAGLAGPAYAAGTGTLTSPGVINIANAGSYLITGTADPLVNAVSVELDDAAGALVTDGSLTPSATGQTWSATINTTTLVDGPVDVVVRFDNTCLSAGCASDATVDKDTVAPDAPTVFPDGVDPQPSGTDIFIESLTDQARTHFTFGTPTAVDPTEASAPVPDALVAAQTLTTSEQVKAITFDLAGNPSPILAADFTVTGAPATAVATTTALAVSPASPAAHGTPVTLSATVSPAAAGTFEYFDGTTSLGASGAVTPADGAHSFTAKFTPTDPAAFNPSTSPATSFTITAPVTPPAGGGGTPPTGGTPPIVVLPPTGGTPPIVITLPAVTAPRLAARAPAASATGVSIYRNIVAKFNVPVTGVTSRSFTLRTRSGIAVPAVVTYSSLTRMATLNPTRTLAADTTYIASLSTAIKAAAPLALTRWSFITGARPAIAAYSPRPNTGNVVRTANLTVRFTENVVGVSRYSVVLVTLTGVRVPAVVSYNRTIRVATVNPSSALLAHTWYTVRLTSAIKDLAGNPLVASHWSFLTGR